jgi:hypothetical protein
MNRIAGYTNHWGYRTTPENPTGGFTDAQWASLIREAKAIISAAEAKGISVAGPMGTGTPILTSEHILLNGNSSRGEEYEDFYLTKTPSEEDRRFHLQFVQTFQEKPNREIARGFCKTKKKPYDAVVASILAVAKRIGKGMFTASTDDGALKRVLASRLAEAGLAPKTAAHRLDGARGHQLLPATLQRKLPPIYSQENVADPLVQVKLFSPYTGAVWYLTEYDPSSNEAFGWADLGHGMGELGYIPIDELEGMNQNGLPLVERDTTWRPVPLSRAKSSRTAASSSKYPSVARQIEEDYKRKAITQDERRELLEAIENAGSRQDAERVIEQARKGRTAASTRVAYEPPFHNAAQADEALGEAYRALIDLKLGFDSWYELASSAQPLYRQIMKAVDAVVTARQATTQVRAMVARKRY